MTARRRLALAASLASLATAGLAEGATLRFQASQVGDFVVIGNTLGQDCRSQVPAPVLGTVGACGSNTSDRGPDVYWRSNDPSAANADTTITMANARTTAVLSLPAGVTVTYARLYWSAAGSTAAADTSVTLDRPGGFSSAITADASFTAATTGMDAQNYYQSTANVTALVQANGVGAYRLAGMDVTAFSGIRSDGFYAAWSLVVFYSKATDPPRDLALFDGLDILDSQAQSQGITVSGFQVPTTSYDAKVAVIAYRGSSAGASSLNWNGTAVSDAINPQNKFFNGSRSFLGAAVSNAGDLPRLAGTEDSMSGVDIDVIDVTSRVSPGDTSATVTAKTSVESYLVGAFITSIATVRPELSTSTKTVADLTSHPGGAVLRGDTLEYTITVINSGFDSATAVVVNDVLPAGLTFVPGSIQVTTGANIGTKTDGAGDDHGEYISASRTIRVRVGTGATAAAGGSLAPGVSTTVVFRVTIDAVTLGTVNNQATITASGASGSLAQDYLSDGNGATAGAPPTSVLVEQCAQSSDCSGGTPLCLGSVSPRVCVACLSNTNCSGTTPICNTATHVCGGCTADAQCPTSAPVCQTSGACGACSATNIGLCGGSTPVCDTGVASCVQCLSSGHCSGATPVCNTAVKTCVGCLANADCGGSTPVCDLAFLTCRACGGDSECGGATPACHPSGACRQCSTGNTLACSGATPVCEVGSGTCVRCVANADCSGATPVCNLSTHTCRACGGDSECGGATPACQPGGACGQCSATNATLCAGATPVCNVPSATCVPCTSNAQCGGTTPVCNAATHTCRACAGDGECGGATPACQSTGACGQCSATNATSCGGATPVCYTPGGTCVPCLSNAQCGGATPVCNTATNTCRACAGDGECGGATPACQPGGACGQCSATNASLCGGASPVCYTPGGICVPCTSNVQCGGATPICNPATHTCRGCAGDGECGGATPACQPGGACGVCSATNATRCMGATPVCDVATAICVPCTSNAQCGGTTPVCNLATHTCRPCAADGECGGATPACQPSGSCGQCSLSYTASCSGATPVCYTATGTCVPCLADADCGGATPVCDPALHSCRACSGDNECGGATPACQPGGSCGQCSAGNSLRCTGGTPLCFTATGSCVSCLANGDCSGTTPICDGSTHTCRGCGGDGDCAGPTPACQPSGACGVCSATNKTRCTGSMPACNVTSGTCVNCNSDAECGGVTPVCNVAAHVCRACAGDGECSGSTPACQTSGACGQCSASNATLCTGTRPLCHTSSGTCVSCLANADCPASTPTCDPTFHSCRGCAGDGECGGSTPACQASGACGQCSATNVSLCSGGTPLCRTTSGTCVACLSGANCSGSSPVCDAATNICRACAGDGECGGATPACQPSGACGQCSATNATRCTGTTSVCDLGPGICVACTSNGQCSGTAPVCDLGTQICRACAGDSECGGNTPVCQPSGACGECSASNAARCTGTTPVCYAAAGVCVECLDNAGCGAATPVCDLIFHACRACGGDSECGGAQPACQPGGACGQCSATNATRCGGTVPVCNTLSGTCVGCLSNGHCGAFSPVCDGASQICRACASDSECGASTPICLPSGACAPCTATDVSHCPASAPRCDTSSGVGVCVACLADAHCGGSTPVCSMATRTCVACTTDGAPSCTDPERPACQRSGALSGACTECSATNGTLCGGVKPVCLANLGICGCAGPSDDRSCGAADSGLICSGAGGYCVPGCGPAPRNGCPTGQTCLDVTNGVGQCSGAMCHSDADCRAPLSHCDLSGGADGRCVQCLYDTDCDAPLICDPGKRTCVECTPGNTQQCRAEQMGDECLADGRCGCQVDGDCGGVDSGRVCNATTSRCMTGCRGTGGNGCPIDRVCSSTTNAVGQCDPRPVTTDGGAPGDGGPADAAADGSAGDAGPRDGGTDARDGGSSGDGSAGYDATVGDGAVTDAGTVGDAAVGDARNDAANAAQGRYLAGGGCHCATSDGGPGGHWLGLILLLGVIGRRRRRR